MSDPRRCPVCLKPAGRSLLVLRWHDGTRLTRRTCRHKGRLLAPRKGAGR